MPKVNPTILQWARETAGLTLGEAVEKLGIRDARGVPAIKRLAAYESGAVEPSRPLLLKMVQHYRRPLLTFYLPQPPRVSERGHDFRTLPPDHSRRDDALVDALIRDIKARQEMVRAVLEAEDEAVSLPFVASMTMQDGVSAVLDSIVRTLELDREQFRNGIRGDRTAPKGFTYLRERAERAGIFVLLVGNLGSHHSTLDVEIFRGFALADPVAPFIVINDQDSDRAWCFTLLHEVAHIWLGATGVSGANAISAIEQFCNDVAGNFLLPNGEIERERAVGGLPLDEVAMRIGEIADARQVSRSLVTYKLFRAGIIDRSQWSQLSAMFRQHWLRKRQLDRERSRDGEGPNYYTVRRHRLGGRLLDLSRRMVADGALSPSKAARILAVRPANVFPLLSSADPSGRAA
ncbi:MULTISPECIES: ImmA/IrrE family metallo-endopeptidase [Chelatococcus]|uniref:Zn-dependent peptidase ImmA (M78 family) n=1 Tax=Chelatococcus caeni TaxID=1348468 RepID=A0A840C6R4_9HYPH|nr:MULTISPECIES: XRE family transcriptional regulator [Chelatococcus]ALA17511.1 peptidase [Chelatococcus sp. CO-6]MBB4019119.1 Zn-dependent peptidase ImmA (M78 family) [Chelatococcus caeni]